MRTRCDTFFRCVCLVEQPTVTFLPTEHRNHRQVPPADCQCNGTCVHNRDPSVRSGSVACVSRRCTAVPIGAEGAARSALKATSEVGTGGPATRIIEADVLPTSPGHGDASGALGGL